MPTRRQYAGPSAVKRAVQAATPAAGGFGDDLADDEVAA